MNSTAFWNYEKQILFLLFVNYLAYGILLGEQELTANSLKLIKQRVARLISCAMVQQSRPYHHPPLPYQMHFGSASNPLASPQDSQTPTSAPDTLPIFSRFCELLAQCLLPAIVQCLGSSHSGPCFLLQPGMSLSDVGICFKFMSQKDHPTYRSSLVFSQLHCRSEKAHLYLPRFSHSRKLFSLLQFTALTPGCLGL